MKLIAVVVVILIANAVLLAFGGVVAFLLHLVLPGVEIGTILTVAMISVVGSISILGNLFSSSPVAYLNRLVVDESDGDEGEFDEIQEEWADRIPRKGSRGRGRGRRR